VVPTHPGIGRKRPVNLTLNESLVAQAKRYSRNLSATVENLLADNVAGEAMASQECQQRANACVADWNVVHEAVGSFADDHTTL
jgi:antitoxin CcdA